jgi:translation initiation factor 2B subunit (eIF-2B alpha/beta/delta family)
MTEADWHTRITQDLATIRTDHEHGASYLAQFALALLAYCGDLPQIAQISEAETVATLQEVCRTMAQARPSMASFAHIASRVLATLYTSATPLVAAHATIQELQGNLMAAPIRIAARLGALLPPSARIVTLSRSETVLRVLTARAHHLGSVTVLESRPGGEGAVVARELTGQWHTHTPPIPITLMADAAMMLAVADATCCVVGADALLAEGFAVNKVGIHPLALAARAAHIPCYVLAETTKIAPRSWPWSAEHFDPALILPDPPPGMTVDATVFERVPLALVTLITEMGILPGEQIAAMAAELDEGYAEVAGHAPLLP